MKLSYKSILPALFLYLISTGASYATFNFLNPSSPVIPPTPTADPDGLNIDPSAPRTETCPLNGALYTVTEREAWEKLRPAAVMIENHQDARPQSGLQNADIVYEAVAEGGVTRFMGLFYCGAVAQDTTLAPIRSARTYFVNLASEYNFPLYVHIGGANCSADKLPNGGSGPCKSDKRVQAIEQIQSYGWRLENDIDGMSVGLPVFYRDSNRLGDGRQLATEHTVITSSERIWTKALERGWTNLSPEGDAWDEGFRPWSFQDEADQGNRGTVSSIAYDFWGYDLYTARWAYDPATNSYSRSTGGAPHQDLNTNQTLSFKNIVIQFAPETGPVDDLKHMLYDVVGDGDGLVFRDGKVEEVTWAKDTRTDRTIFSDQNGAEFKFTRGPIWIAVMDVGSQVDYQ